MRDHQVLIVLELAGLQGLEDALLFLVELDECLAVGRFVVFVHELVEQFEVGELCDVYVEG